MTNDQLKAASDAAGRLRNLGIEIPDNATFTIFSDAIGAFGGKRPYNVGREDHVRAWMAPQRPAPSAWAFRAIDPEKVKPHPRAAEIDQAQPPMMTPNGVGNGAERQHGYGRGQ